MPQAQRVNKNTRSVLALYGFLVVIIRQPSDFAANDRLRTALKSQGALSKWSDEEAGITASSLNTVKRIANTALQGGFEELDRTRISALNAIRATEHQSHRPQKLTKAGLAIQKTNLEHELQQALQDLWHVTSAISRAFSLWQKCAEQTNNPSVVELCRREQRELRARLSLCKLPIANRSLYHTDAAD